MKDGVAVRQWQNLNNVSRLLNVGHPSVITF